MELKIKKGMKKLEVYSDDMNIGVNRYKIVLINNKWFYNNYSSWFSTKHCLEITAPSGPSTMAFLTPLVQAALVLL